MELTERFSKPSPTFESEPVTPLRRKWWPGDEGGWCVTLYVYLMAIFSLPMILALRARVVPALFNYYEHAIGYIQVPFP